MLAFVLLLGCRESCCDRVILLWPLAPVPQPKFLILANYVSTQDEFDYFYRRTHQWNISVLHCCILFAKTQNILPSWQAWAFFLV